MRVLWITGSFYPRLGGLQVYVERLTNSLSKLHEVGLVTALNHRAPENPSIVHFRVANLTRSGTPAAWQQAALEVARIVANFRPDVVHFVATVHGNDLTWPSEFIPGQDSTEWIVHGLNACDHVLTVSNHSAG